MILIWYKTGYEFLSFAKNIGKNIGKNISKNLSGKYNQKILHHTKQFAKDAIKTVSKKVIQKTAEETCDLIGNKIPDKTIKISKTSQQKNPETITNEPDREIPQDRYKSSEERQKTIDDLKLI